jgi:phospholipid/cholesterol/gamma-HCH transport system ATP-binding protein
MSYIQVDRVSKSFNGNQVLSQLSLSIERGETMVIMGGSGHGKSVLLKMIIGLIEADEGSIWIDGIDITKLKTKEVDKIRKKMGFLFQSSALFDSLKVGENVGFTLSQHTKKSQAEINRIVAEKLRLVGLSGAEDLKPAELSGGMRKRVGLARAIAMQPEIMLYDEPTAGLDPINSEAISTLIKDLNQKLGITSVVVTHDMNCAFSIADKMAMIHQGKIVEAGTPEEFRASSNLVVQNFIASYLYLKYLRRMPEKIQKIEAETSPIAEFGIRDSGFGIREKT